MMQQSVDQGMLFVSSCGMNHHARRLVQDKECFIFVKDFERHLFWLSLCRARLRPMHLHLFSRSRTVSRLYHSPVDFDVPAFNQPLDGSAGNRRKFAPQVGIETVRWTRPLDSQNFSAGG